MELFGIVLLVIRVLIFQLPPLRLGKWWPIVLCFSILDMDEFGILHIEAFRLSQRYLEFGNESVNNYLLNLFNLKGKCMSV